MKGKILDSWVINNDTYIKKATKYGTFEAIVNCHEEDLPYKNEWDGYRFAEYRCDLSALKEKIKWLNQRYLGLLQGIEVLEQAGKDPLDLKPLYDFTHSIAGQIKKEKQRYQNASEGYIAFTDKEIKKRKEFRESRLQNEE